MLDRNMPELFVGKSQQDYGEPDTFDGTLWALPTAQDRADEAGGGPEADVFLIAEHIKDEGDAKRLALAWNVHDDLLAACEAVAYAASEIILLSDKSTNAGAAAAGAAVTLKNLVLAAIAKAKKES